MKPAREPGTRQYDLHVSLTITSDLDVSPLYIGSMLLDGIFAIDDAGLLFPGVTWPPPQERLVDVTVGVEAIARPSDLPTTNAAYQRLMGRARKRPQKLLHDIDDDIN